MYPNLIQKNRQIYRFLQKNKQALASWALCAQLLNSVRPCKSKFVVFIIRKKFERVKVRAPKGERQNAGLKVLKLAILTMLDIILLLLQT